MLSQKLSAACFNHVDVANEGVVEARFEHARLDLETVFRAQYERITRVIAGVIRDPGRAEELAVEVFLKWDRAAKAQGEGTEGWLYRAAVRIALNELRRQTLRSRYERLLSLVTSGRIGGSPADDVYATQDEQQRVRIVLGAIEQRQAELLLLRCNDLSYQELASTLNLNPASVGTLLRRALEAFRREFIRRYGKERYGQE